MIEQVNRLFEERKADIDDWFKDQCGSVPLPLYASVDIRNSHHKIAVVDTNAFPAGFNNLCSFYHRQLSETFKQYIRDRFPEASRLMIVPEDHTRNQMYMENIRMLSEQLVQAGYEVRIGSANPQMQADELTLQAAGGEVSIQKLKLRDKSIYAADFEPDLIISNNDFTSGVPEILKDISQPLLPPTGLGWHLREKGKHFQIMNQLLNDFADLLGLDPWLISTRINSIEDIDFRDEQKRGHLADLVDHELDAIKQSYTERGIEDEPLVFIKNSTGTYGMAVMTATSGDDIRKANRKTREKMKMGKGRQAVNRLVIQEGIPTRDEVDNCPMEPVIYLVGCTAVGGFYRIHCSRTERQNLNVSGMEFRKLCFHQVAERRPEKLDDSCQDAAALLSVYGTLARIAVLALSRETQYLETDK